MYNRDPRTAVHLIDSLASELPPNAQSGVNQDGPYPVSLFPELTRPRRRGLARASILTPTQPVLAAALPAPRDIATDEQVAMWTRTLFPEVAAREAKGASRITYADD
jgi:hypothetical protein